MPSEKTNDSDAPGRARLEIGAPRDVHIHEAGDPDSREAASLAEEARAHREAGRLELAERCLLGAIDRIRAADPEGPLAIVIEVESILLLAARGEIGPARASLEPLTARLRSYAGPLPEGFEALREELRAIDPSA